MRRVSRPKARNVVAVCSCSALAVSVGAVVSCSMDEQSNEPVASVQQADWDPTTDLSEDCQISAQPDTLVEFAKKCDTAIGDTVPEFDCDDGTLVDEGHVTAPMARSRACSAIARTCLITNAIRRVASRS